MKILPLFVLLACVAWQACAQDYESSPPVVSRGLLKRPNPRAKATTTTTTPAPLDDAEYEEEPEYAAEDSEPSSEAPPSSTEGKKLVGGGVRPFRSNTDLLETLKKRRQQASEAKIRSHSNSEPSAAAEASVDSAKSSYNNKKRAGNTNSPAKETTNEEVPAPAPSKPSRGRFGRPASRSSQPEASEEQSDVEPASPARSGRAFSRRGSN